MCRAASGECGTKCGMGVCEPAAGSGGGTAEGDCADGGCAVDGAGLVGQRK